MHIMATYCINDSFYFLVYIYTVYHHLLSCLYTMSYVHRLDMTLHVCTCVHHYVECMYASLLHKEHQSLKLWYI